jgi:genome maintenance exonuclease 1
MWNTFSPILKDINNVMGLETMMYSDKLELAGTADCIAEYKGELSIIDFKTSSKPKEKKWISNYFVQTAFYAAFLGEMVGILPKKLVILIAVDDNPPMVFVENTMDWLPEAIKVRAEFKRIKGY